MAIWFEVVNLFSDIWLEETGKSKRKFQLFIHSIKNRDPHGTLTWTWLWAINIEMIEIFMPWNEFAISSVFQSNMCPKQNLNKTNFYHLCARCLNEGGGGGFKKRQKRKSNTKHESARISKTQQRQHIVYSKRTEKIQ